MLISRLPSIWLSCRAKKEIVPNLECQALQIQCTWLGLECTAAEEKNGLDSLALEPEQPHVCPINDLPDYILQRFFELLSPLDRLLLSEVCKRWNELSRMPWCDISSLDLTPIPNPNIQPIIQQCPNLKAVFALDKIFSRSELSVLARIPLSSLKLYKCAGNIVSAAEEENNWSWNSLPFALAESQPIAAWKELILNDFGMPTYLDWIVDEELGGMVPRDGRKPPFCVSCDILPTSLERLLLAGIHVTKLLGHPQQDRIPAFNFEFFCSSEILQNLTCLILITCKRGRFRCSTILVRIFCEELQTLQNLRELFLGSFRDTVRLSFDTLALGLPRLEVLFLNNAGFNHPTAEDGAENEDRLVPLVTRHPALRILCITGWYPHEHVIPVRRLFPNGFAANPVPLLYIFLGKMAAENIVFERSSPDALKVYPITEPLPTFLEKEEIAPILRGVWIAQQIKVDAKYGCKPIHDPNEGTNDVSIRVVDPE